METMKITDTNSRSQLLAREVIDRIADKWTLLVIDALGKNEKLRFTQLRKHINGISQKMLTQTLRRLERDGLISRHVYPVVPPKVEYKLTELGGSLLVTVKAICGWVDQNLHSIESARQRYESKNEEL
ncbi:MAG TPA: transcriptional regulator [Providencia sp.]|uniref:winged helix-turn-helix transcriptional regulator n=1 Tax=Providencia sp. TaxID=589 RepID=UPI000E988B25|nr:helix-turn-helix domain-containing protein [Providencia sp.]HBO22040.1 transcriptional regulator [Providencia sp.]